MSILFLYECGVFLKYRQNNVDYAMSTSNEFDDEDDAAELKFTSDIKDCETLLISEVYLILQKRRQEMDEQEIFVQPNENFMRCYEYVQAFARFRSQESVRDLRALLEHKNFHRFEVAQLGSLCPESAEEAKSFIPSLHSKIDDSDLEFLLRELSPHFS
ncbi:DNA-directed RNA polymerase II 16 kDa polypeptide [Trichinella zimbabwensis]|uniref:DNA-directed RNA polymerase II 16 kDa polypeptide n=1 Tax=Trichinella zimbabwensis TaxID=268475 RepID=A0A0V1HJU4_9BILA|nr:DNA-directed RNA polymerase II 16 kDa polypeptide [Trichinella zimbabwensis]